MNDNVNHPKHYTQQPYECIEFTESDVRLEAVKKYHPFNHRAIAKLEAGSETGIAPVA